MEFLRSLFATDRDSFTVEALYLFLSISVIYLRISFVKTALIMTVTSIISCYYYISSSMIIPLKFHYFYTKCHYRQYALPIILLTKKPGHFSDPIFFATPVIERILILLVVIIIHRLYCLYLSDISYVHFYCFVRTSCHYAVAQKRFFNRYVTLYIINRKGKATQNRHGLLMPFPLVAFIGIIV